MIDFSLITGLCVGFIAGIILSYAVIMAALYVFYNEKEKEHKSWLDKWS